MFVAECPECCNSLVQISCLKRVELAIVRGPHMFVVMFIYLRRRHVDDDYDFDF